MVLRNRAPPKILQHKKNTFTCDWAMCFKSYMHKRSLVRHQRTHEWYNDTGHEEKYSDQRLLMTEEKKKISRKAAQRRYYIRRKARELQIKKAIEDLKRKERNERLQIQKRWEMDRKKYQAFQASLENPWCSDSEDDY